MVVLYRPFLLVGVSLRASLPLSLAYTTMRALCHDHLSESLSYGHVRLEGVDELVDNFGKLEE